MFCSFASQGIKKRWRFENIHSMFITSLHFKKWLPGNKTNLISKVKHAVHVVALLGQLVPGQTGSCLTQHPKVGTLRFYAKKN
jgi:hypothetical protein